MTVTCPECRTPRLGHLKFCAGCGHQFDDALSAASQAAGVAKAQSSEYVSWLLTLGILVAGFLVAYASLNALVGGNQASELAAVLFVAMFPVQGRIRRRLVARHADPSEPVVLPPDASSPPWPILAASSGLLFFAAFEVGAVASGFFIGLLYFDSFRPAELEQIALIGGTAGGLSVGALGAYFVGRRIGRHQPEGSGLAVLAAAVLVAILMMLLFEGILQGAAALAALIPLAVLLAIVLLAGGSIGYLRGRSSPEISYLTAVVPRLSADARKSLVDFAYQEATTSSRVSQPTESPPPPDGTVAGGAVERRPCPNCAESIPVAARYCRFCQRSLDGPAGGEPEPGVG